jgi:chromosome segregation ATPase
MARGGVTFTEVDEAARYLQGIGRNPTVDAIREHLGTGSRTTLAEHLKRWKSLQADGEGRLPQPLLSLITGLWDSLQSLAAQRVQENQAIADQAMTILKSQLQTTQQSEAQLNQTLHQLQETLDAEQRIKLTVDTQLQTIEKSYDKLNAAHQSTLQQLDNSKQENQRLHQLATQIQANLEHYQQAVQQQQIEQNLAKEKQYAIYAQELAQLKRLLDETNVRFNHSEKVLATNQLQLQQTQKNHEELHQRYTKIMDKYQETEHALIQLTAQVNFQQNQAEKNEQDLSKERHAHNQLQQKMAVLAEQLQRAQDDLHQAEDKIEVLRQEKLFLSQEKAQMDGALKQLQKTKAVA